MVECVIRAATSVDIAAAASIYEHFVTSSTATFELLPPDTTEMQRGLACVTEMGLPYLVGARDEYVVG